MPFRRQNDEYSPHVVKRQRLDSSPHPIIGSPVIQTPRPHRPDHAVAGSSRSSFDRSYPRSHTNPHPLVPAVPESSSSLRTYAKDRVLYIQMPVNCSWHTPSLTSVHADVLGLVSVHVFVPSVEWSDGGPVWGLPAAVFRFGPEGDVPNSAAAGHTACLCRYAWQGLVKNVKSLI